MSDDRVLEFETRLAAALRAADPVVALRELRADPEFAREFGVAHAAEDGFKIAALLVAKERFSRLQLGSPVARAWFESDPASFAREFRRYHAATPPHDFFTRGEGAAFDRFE